jgi:hypothetical protein
MVRCGLFFIRTRFNPETGIWLGQSGIWAGSFFSRHISLPLPVIIPEMVHVQVCDKSDDLACYCNPSHVSLHLWPDMVRKFFCTSFLGRFALSCLSIHMYQLCSHWIDFCEIWYWRLSWKSGGKIQIWLKLDENVGTLHEDLSTFILLMATYNHHKIDLFKPNSIRLLGQPCCISMAMLAIFIILLTATHNSTIQRELTVTFPWQQWLREHTTLHYMYIAYLVKYSYCHVSCDCNALYSRT